MDEDPRVLFGLKLVEVRKRRGWSQERLALESGLARSYLGGVERGQRNIALLNIVKLAETLGVPAGALLEAPEGEASAGTRTAEGATAGTKAEMP